LLVLRREKASFIVEGKQLVVVYVLRV
jgi:hypothetical protein